MNTAGGLIGTQLYQMKRSAERIGEIHLALFKEIEKLRESVEHLDLSWEGEANRLFMTAMESDFTTMYVLLSLVWEARRLLEMAEGRYQESERGVRYAVQGTN